MLDDKTSKQLEYKVWERLNLDQLDNPKMDLLQKKVLQIAVRAAIITLQEYEKLNNDSSE